MDYFNCSINYISNTKMNITISALLVLMSITTVFLVIYLEKKFKVMHNNLNYKEDLINSLYSNVDDVFVVYDNINHLFEYISPNFEKVIGISDSELKKNMLVLFDFALPEVKNDFIFLLSEKPSSKYVEMEFEYDHPVLKQKKWLVVRIYPVYKNNVICKYIASILEITRKYQANAEVRKALSESQKANEAKKEFLSHMSHELKTPINAIIGMTQIAMNSPEDKGKIEDCLEKINYSSRNLLFLINNILDSAKNDNDTIVLIKEPFSLKKTIAEYSSLMTSQMEMKHINYKLILQTMEQDYLIGDSLRITQILGNCLSNAIKFTTSGGNIILEISELVHNESDGVYQFRISDTGKGMSQEYLQHIYEPFVQEDSSISSLYGGSGLGMSIVKQLIDLMGGTIQVESRLGEGTTVTIIIPLDIAMEDSEKSLKGCPENPVVSKSIPNISAYDFSSLRILVVEDNEINLEITTEYLRNIKVQVETATNGCDAIQLFKNSCPGYYDAILMDVRMPGMSGYEVSKHIRSLAHADAEHITIIAMSADNYVNQESCVLNSMNYHVSKPIEVADFYSILSSVYSKKCMEL